MPQLNPAPWAYIFISSWLILMVMNSKMLHLHHMCPPRQAHSAHSKLQMGPNWHWMWQ